MTPAAALTAGLATEDPVLEAQLRDGLAKVEVLLRETVDSDYPFVTGTSRHLVDAGGKRYRPLLALLCAQLGDPSAPGVLASAVVVELTHLATLYHDDVMDEAPLRRGAESANSRWTNTVAILTGDFLFARASDLLADLGPEAVRLQARTFERLVKGQIRETVGPVEGEEALAHHLEVLSDKTASLIATSCRFGALMSGAGQAATEIVTRFGEAFGMAFQLADDLIDITSESDASGKTPGTDLREGVATLPVLYARAMAGPADARLIELLAADLTDDDLHAEALSLLRAHPAMAAARAESRRWAEQARESLSGLPDSPARTALAGLCDVVVARTG